MKKTDHKVTLIHLYLLGRYIIKNAKNYNSEEMMMTSIMVMLNEKTMTIRELADLFDVNHSFMSMMIQKMNKKGLIHKKKNLKDTRYKLASLSPLGKKIVKNEVNTISEYHCKHIFKDLTDKETDQFDRMMLKLNFKYDPGGIPLP